jgi:hypothetical protein
METRKQVSPEIGIEQEFHRLADEWKSGRGPTSSAVKMAAHPAYQRIIAIGKADPDKVVPLLLAELARSPDHWFMALHAITGADPVPVTSRGRLTEMAAAWIRWWEKDHGGER